MMGIMIGKEYQKCFQLLHDSTQLMKWGITIRKYKEKGKRKQNQETPAFMLLNAKIPKNISPKQ